MHRFGRQLLPPLFPVITALQLLSCVYVPQRNKTSMRLCAFVSVPAFAFLSCLRQTPPPPSKPSPCTTAHTHTCTNTRAIAALQGQTHKQGQSYAPIRSRRGGGAARTLERISHNRRWRRGERSQASAPPSPVHALARTHFHCIVSR